MLASAIALCATPASPVRTAVSEVVRGVGDSAVVVGTSVRVLEAAGLEAETTVCPMLGRLPAPCLSTTGRKLNLFAFLLLNIR